MVIVRDLGVTFHSFLRYTRIKQGNEKRIVH